MSKGIKFPFELVVISITHLYLYSIRSCKCQTSGPIFSYILAKFQRNDNNFRTTKLPALVSWGIIVVGLQKDMWDLILIGLLDPQRDTELHAPSKLGLSASPLCS